jgi:serine/threonine protein kinase
MLSHSALERFEIRNRIGSGSFGTVYEVLDRHRNRVVALKVLDRVAPDTVARFKREFRTLALLRHPNLASLYELIVIDGQWLLTMELIRGSELLEHLAFIELQQSFVQERVPTLTDFDADRTISVARRETTKVSPLYILQIRTTFQQLAVALAVLHAQGVVHRDVKPSNVLIARDGRVVVLDFGLVIEESVDDTLDRRVVVGTPGYMAPEQISAASPTVASDWYSFGVLLFQALTGRMPFEGKSTIDVLHSQLHSEAPHPSEIADGIPDDLASLAHACLHRDPLKRPTGAQVLERLGILDFEPARIERSRPRKGKLIGRGRELRTLRGWIDALAPGDSRIVLLEGAPGGGKTALLDQFLDDVRAEGGALILGGRCQPWESLPFNAVDSIVDALAREARRAASPAVDAVMGRAVAVTELFPTLATGAAIGEETVSLPSGDRLIKRAASELRALMNVVADGRVILIVLDDAQWGDYQSARMLRELMLGERGGLKIALILSYTIDDWRTSLLLQALDLGEIRPVPRRMQLKDLSAAMTQQWVGAKKLATAVHRATHGNPLLIEIAMDGEGSLDDGVAMRLGRCSAAARQLFEAVCAAEGPVEQSELEAAAELFELDEPLRSLTAERLVRIRRTGNLTEIDVTHPLLRSPFAVRR